MKLPSWTHAGRDTWLSAAALSMGAAGFGYALQLTNGTLDPIAIRWLIATIALAALAVTAAQLSLLERIGDSLAMLILGAGLVVQIYIHLTTPPGMYLQVPPQAYAEHHFWIAAAAILGGACLSTKPWLGRVAFPLLMVTYFMLGLWLLHASPGPYIDVFAWHREAFHALGKGLDPYAITMPNIYGRVDWYAPGLADATHVAVGYPYPPLSLLLAAPGHLVAGDYRYANLVALTATGGLIAYARPGRLSTAAAVLFLLTPRGLFVLEQGWTEANCIFLLAATVFVACRAPKALPFAFGLLLAVKQYFVLVAPLAILMLPRPLRFREVARFFVTAFLIAAGLTLPFALWNFPAFFRSVVAFQSQQPFRADALSFLAWTARGGLPILPLWLSFAVVPIAWALGLWRAPRTPAGFAAGSALVFLLFFGFAKQAFCNYYFLIVGALCCAAAALAPGEEQLSGAASGGVGPAAKVADAAPRPQS